jgi:hypothetical protein
MAGLIAISTGRSARNAVLRSLWWGFVGGLFMELWIRAFVMLGVLSESFRGLALIFFWCIYSNGFYYLSYRDAENKLFFDVIASLVFALTLGAATALIFSLQSFRFTAPTFWVFGLSLALGCIICFGVWLQRRLKRG